MCLPTSLFRACPHEPSTVWRIHVTLLSRNRVPDMPGGDVSVVAELVVRAPASTANLGPGFDCAAAALDLWNELEVTEGAHDVAVEGEGAGELPTDDRHLALRAFSLVAPVERYRFRFVNRIPLERGLGSSAATVAGALVAGTAVSGHDVPADELLRLGLELEGHADNLAAALRGGVCLIWQNGAGPHAARIAA